MSGTRKRPEPSAGGTDSARVDLHLHTTASDGVRSPGEVVGLANEAGLAAVAITDHDSVAGLEEAAARGEELGVEVVPGVELTSYVGKIELHVVGLFIEPVDAEAVRQVEALRGWRRERMFKMVEKLRGLGVEVDPEEVMAEAPNDAAVGRPHLASVLVKRGYVETVSEAFGTYIGGGGPAYVPKTVLPPEGAIALVRELRGLPVYAHPGVSRLDDKLGGWKDAGLAALEIWHPKHSAVDTEYYLGLARKRGLLVSGGSDFHGPGRSDAEMGAFDIPYSVLEDLRAGHEGAR